MQKLNKRHPVYIRLSRIKRRIVSRHFKLIRIILFSIVLGLIFGLLYVGASNFKKSQFAEYLNYARIFMLPDDSKLRSTNGRTNILILGKSGEGHIAPDLTDTIILASVNHKTSSIDLISLPRDIWIEDLRAKLNSVYYWGNQKKVDGGVALSKSTVEEITSLPIHYALIIDFSGFEKIIDAVGGIDVHVEHGFVDERFPIPGRENDECGDNGPEFSCRYETIVFEKGIDRMNGSRALKFVRSRQSADLEEGTDFARSKRQQAVLSAIKNKALSTTILFSPGKIFELISLGREIIETDLPEDTQVVLGRALYDSRNSINNHIVPEEILKNPPLSPEYDNLYVFIPNGESWAILGNWVKTTLGDY